MENCALCGKVSPMMYLRCRRMTDFSTTQIIWKSFEMVKWTGNSKVSAVWKPEWNDVNKINYFTTTEIIQEFLELNILFPMHFRNSKI